MNVKETLSVDRSPSPVSRLDLSSGEDSTGRARPLQNRDDVKKLEDLQNQLAEMETANRKLTEEVHHLTNVTPTRPPKKTEVMPKLPDIRNVDNGKEDSSVANWNHPRMGRIGSPSRCHRIM